MSRPRKQTYTLERYLQQISEGDISNNANTQRNFVWGKESINELIVTVLTDDYIPPIILGEKEDSQLVIVDGGQRSFALTTFRNGNYKITSSIENSVIPYKKKIKEDNGKTKWEDASFDIKNKTYDKLPDELKKKFNEYQIETVIHENCNNYKISKYIKRYNNHTAMNTSQKSFTYLYNFAEQIKEILKKKFFLDHSVYTESEKNKGVVERVVAETVMCCNYFDEWKRENKQLCKFLNEHASEEDFIHFSNNLSRLENIITEDIRDIFNSKESFIFITLFDKFTKLGVADIKYADFLREFKNNLRKVKVNKSGMSYDEIDKNTSTKNKSVIYTKMNFLEKLMLDYLHTSESDTKMHVENTEDEVSFISENVGLKKNIVQGDIDFYKESLDCLKENTIKIGSKLLDKENQLSLLAMIAYSYKSDIDLDEWMIEYAKKNNNYSANQKDNFLHMKNDLEQFISNKNKEEKKSA